MAFNIKESVFDFTEYISKWMDFPPLLSFAIVTSFRAIPLPSFMNRKLFKSTR